MSWRSQAQRPKAQGGSPEIWPAYVGTAVHAALADSLLRDNNRRPYPVWIVEAPVLPRPIEPEVKGTADLYYIPTGTVVDHKIQGVEAFKKSTKDQLKTVYHVQLQTYGLGHELAGREVKDVALAAWPKGGNSQDLTIVRRPYQKTVADRAIDRWVSLSEAATPPWEVKASPEASSDCFFCPFYRPGLAQAGPDGCPGK